jgi:hypothetical protein
MLAKNAKNTEFLASKTTTFDIKASTHKLTRVFLSSYPTMFTADAISKLCRFKTYFYKNFQIQVNINDIIKK